MGQINYPSIDELYLELEDKYPDKSTAKEDAIKFAGLLLKSGIGAGDKIAIIAPESYESTIATFGANAIGVQVVTMRPIDEVEVKPFYDGLDAYRPKMVLFYNSSAAWMSAVKSYAKYIEVYLAAQPIDPYTQQYFGFRSAIDSIDISLKDTLREIKRHSKDNVAEKIS